MVTIFGAGLLVGTALTVIIPEGVNSLYMQRGVKPVTSPVQQEASNGEAHEHHKTEEYSSTIGLSLVLGFVFMMVVDQISSRKSHEVKRSATATIGLVVHAAGIHNSIGTI